LVNVTEYESEKQSRLQWEKIYGSKQKKVL
jgi:hypothetical protein